MPKFTIEYYEWYKDSYEIEAENEEDARIQLREEIQDGKQNGPEQCYNSGIISVTEIIEPTLAEIIAEEKIDEIEDDQEFCEAENELVREYCIRRNFNLSKEDLRTIRSRGLSSDLHAWKELYKEAVDYVDGLEAIH